MPSKLVRVLQGPNGRAEKIFRDKTWLDYPPERVYITTKKEAVADIREQVYVRAEGKCEECGRPVSWENAQMHEERPKGAGGGFTGGEVGMDNCVLLCAGCHQWGPNARHANRRWQTAKIKP